MNLVFIFLHFTLHFCSSVGRYTHYGQNRLKGNTTGWMSGIEEVEWNSSMCNPVNLLRCDTVKMVLKRTVRNATKIIINNIVCVQLLLLYIRRQWRCHTVRHDVMNGVEYVVVNRTIVRRVWCIQIKTTTYIIIVVLLWTGYVTKWPE